MDQKPDFRFEACSRISGFEVECNLSNDVVEIPGKWELDPVAAYSRDIGSFPPYRTTTSLRRLSVRLRRRLRVSSTGLLRVRILLVSHSRRLIGSLRDTRRRARSFLRWLGRWKRHFLDR